MHVFEAWFEIVIRFMARDDEEFVVFLEVGENDAAAHCMPDTNTANPVKNACHAFLLVKTFINV